MSVLKQEISRGWKTGEWETLPRVSVLVWRWLSVHCRLLANLSRRLLMLHCQIVPLLLLPCDSKNISIIMITIAARW